MPKNATGKVQRRSVAQMMIQSQQQAPAEASDILEGHSNSKVPQMETTEERNPTAVKALGGSLRQRIARLLRAG